MQPERHTLATPSHPPRWLFSWSPPMASAEFFTRLVALNAIGPNILDAGSTYSDGDVEKRWVCGGCEADHSSRLDAEECCRPEVYTGSPVSDDGRGLKQSGLGAIDRLMPGSPVSDDGRGLKLREVLPVRKNPPGSPVSDDGRGLKRPRSGALHKACRGFARQR